MRRVRRAPLLCFLLGLSALRADAQIDFARDVRPLFERHCHTCHGPEKQESGYRLDVRSTALRGGDLGDEPIVPGNAERSPLIDYVTGAEDGLRMPPDESGLARLTGSEVETLRRWIDEGAVWPDELSGESAPSEPHWSLVPLGLPAVPAGAAHPVDAFVRAKLAEMGLQPAPEADRQVLIRRLTFDLIGLPPTPDEIDNFLSDQSPRAYEALVERLLASPHYGERWGRHWLDVARYSESAGFEYDRLRDNAWHYRDYVIQSFNDDKPYDRFIREQIAGDVLEPVTRDGIVATSLLVCGPWDQAGNAQKNATQRAITREDELEDLIAVVGQTFLGLTINCARCHAHKFDPISHEEYYRIKSVFEGVKHGERSLHSGAAAEQYRERQRALEQQLAGLRAAIAELDATGARLAAAARPDVPGQPGPAPFARWTFDGSDVSVMPGQLHGGAAIDNGRLQLPQSGAMFKTGPLPKDIREKTLEAWVELADLNQRGGAAISIQNGSGSVFDAIVFAERQPRKWMAGSDGFVRTQDLDIPEESAAPGALLHLAIVYRSDNSIALYRNGTPLGKPYTPATPLQTFSAGDAHILLGMRHTGGGSPWLTGAIQLAALYDRALTDEEIARSYESGGRSIPQSAILAALSPEQRAQREQSAADLDQTQAALDSLTRAAAAVSYAGIRVQPEPTRRLKRGDVNSPDEIVAPGTLSAVTTLNSDFGLPADAPEAERRLRFASWLSDPRNPLPARVMANRVWHFHFGHGLVATPSDFGVSGARPTHPELLDWLAVQLIDSGWSLKALHRLIVNSATYRQSSEFNSAAATVDADNQFLWRFSPRRLEAEAVRDAMLAASGQLNPAAGGPGFRPFQIVEFNAAFYELVDREDPEFNRRSVYRMNINSGKDPLLDAFDCPDPSVKTPRRGVTTTPLQSLELMNNSFVQRQARKLAERASHSAGQNIDAAIRTAYWLTLGREPAIEESKRAVEAARERGLTSVCWLLLNSTEFIYVR